ncbi:hypothetical protein [Salinimicrobium oceani]|uniref:HEAT repeat-containing protein n=1 Tax=Salinimicrobium oceani TaxID=2722702 RepID=A0ABX1CTE0_9FLAO|nr:hypothetical protein [Salinimicrobium oceani]NJW51561.1 hypothetical protein [Salinimicrobium oceani]
MAEQLLLLIEFLSVFLIMVWLTIGFSLIYRKRRLKQLLKIEVTFAEEIGKFLYPSEGKDYHFLKVQRALQKAGAKPSKKGNIQYLIDLMIRAQRSMLGENYSRLQVLFSQIPPYRASLSKLNSRKWYIKARGIREIYEMEQVQYIKEITRERNNPNIFVRREAQIAMVVFLGWESLRFLPYLKREMTLWQQIKIVEKLFAHYPEAQIKYLQKSYATQRPYAQELLMRIIRKFNLFTEVGYIISFLDHKDFDRRETAIYCIKSFRLTGEQLEEVKSKLFKIDNTEQQVQLLRYVQQVSGTPDLEFYKKILKSKNDILELSAAEILWNSGYEQLVHEFYYSQYATGVALKEVI